ncbi:MAG: 30S ribosomal protein S12 methylthiotransferase RimO [Pseudomonadota bacterium]
MNMSEQKPAIGFVSLGCAKALVDSEQVMTELRREGYEIVDDYKQTDLIIINTCAFINEAIEESLLAIKEALLENGKVIVMGCLGKRKVTILEQFPLVLGIVGPNDTKAVLQLVHQHLSPPRHAVATSLPKQGIKLTPSHYAYLKISEGCNHQCTYCIIPELRGPLVSRSIGNILDEAETLVNAGVKELLIIAQDTSAYGSDLKFKTDFWKGRPLKTNLLDLAKTLGEFGIWIRLHYLYPYPNVDELIPLMAEGKILPYLDVPLQHANARILELMRRPAHTEKMLERISKWREQCPNLTIRSTFIVGFPGETDQEFEELLRFLENAQLDRVGCFKYSQVKGAKANELPDYIPEDVKEQRLEALMTLQADISEEKMQKKIGKTIEVLVDEVTEDQMIGRSEGDAPEVDGNVFIEGSFQLLPGDFVKVKITDADAYDLWGKL